MFRVAILGFGSIARAHKSAYQTVAGEGMPVKLVAVCDIDPSRFEGEVATNLSQVSEEKQVNDFHCYTDLEEMLAKEELDLIDICLPTFLHARYTIAMLKRGYHVLCEKPMALNRADCEAMIAAAKESGKQLMIGQALRFFSQYVYLKKVTEDGRFGKLLSGFFERASAPATWGWENWFLDYERSGGPLFDLHVHDVDFVRYLLGEPQKVQALTSSKYMRDDACHTTLFYEGSLPITVIANQQLTGAPFRHSYRAVFEKATVIFDGNVMIYPNEGEGYPYDLANEVGILGEIRYYLDLLLNGKENTLNPPESAAATVRLAETLRESAAAGGAILPFEG